MAISLDSEGRAPTSPLAAQAAPASAPTLSRHALRSAAAEPPEEIEVEVSPPPRMQPSPAPPPRAASAVPVNEAKFWNLPNTITVLRASVVPVLLLHPLFAGEFGSTVMAWIFIVAAVSDLVDG